MNRKGIKIPSKKIHEFVENFMKSLGVKGLKDKKVEFSPYIYTLSICPNLAMNYPF